MPTVADAQVSGRSSASSTESGAEDPPPGGGMVGLLGRMFGGSSAEGGTPAWPLIGAGRDTGTPEAIRRSGWDTAIFDLRGGALGDPETVERFAAGCERRQSLTTARTLNACGTGHGLGSLGLRGLTVLLPALRAMPCLRCLYLSNNRLADAAAQLLASAIADGELASLTVLWLNRNDIGDDGIGALMDAVDVGALYCPLIGPDGPRRNSSALSLRRGSSAVTGRSSTSSASGGEGATRTVWKPPMFALGMPSRRRCRTCGAPYSEHRARTSRRQSARLPLLAELNVAANLVTGAGWSAIVDVLACGALPCLTTIYVDEATGPPPAAAPAHPAPPPPPLPPPPRPPPSCPRLPPCADPDARAPPPQTRVDLTLADDQAAHPRLLRAQGRAQ